MNMHILSIIILWYLSSYFHPSPWTGNREAGHCFTRMNPWLWNVYWTHHSVLHSKITVPISDYRNYCVSCSIKRQQKFLEMKFQIDEKCLMCHIALSLGLFGRGMPSGSAGSTRASSLGTWETPISAREWAQDPVPAKLELQPFVLSGKISPVLFFFPSFQTWGPNMQGLYSATELQP